MPDVPVEFHLPEPVLRVDIALCKEQIIGSVGVDVGHAKGIAENLDAVLETAHLDRSTCLRMRTRDKSITREEHEGCNYGKENGESFYYAGNNSANRP